MKKLYLIAACWLLSGIAFAQQDSTFVGRTQASYDSLFSELDYDKVNTGVLVNKTLIFSNLDAFNGTQDTAIATFADWRQMYLEFYNASVNRSQLRTLNEAANKAYTFINEQKKFPLMMLAYNYNRFAHDAVERGLFVNLQHKVD